MHFMDAVDETRCALARANRREACAVRTASRVTPEEMISLLDSGISIRDLFAFLAAKSSGAA
jgi:hypothetical protein